MDKSFWKNADLYGGEVCTIQARQQFRFWSFREKSIPTQGSRTFKIERLTLKKCEIFSTILHRDGRVTLKTSLGFIQLFS